MRISLERDERWMRDAAEPTGSCVVSNKEPSLNGRLLSPSSARFTFHVSRITRHASRPFQLSTLNSQPSTSQSGIALVIVMISIFVLTMLAAGFAFSMKVETKLAQHANNETQLQWVGRSGVAYAQWVLVLQGTCPLENFDALSQPWATGTASGMCATNGGLADIQSEVHLEHGGSFTWKMTDLERKWNINTANEPILQQALLLTGVDPSEMTPIIGSILNWRAADGNTHHMQGADTEFYQGLEPPYEAKNGPIDDLAELLLIRGITPELYWGPSSTNHTPGAFQQRAGAFAQPQALAYEVGLADLFTPIGNKVNINTASAAVLQLIPGIDSHIAEAIVAGRSGEDDGSGLFGPYRSVTGHGGVNERVPEIAQIGPVVQMLNQYCDVHSRTFEVEVTAHVGGSERTYYATLVRNTPKDIQVLNFHWKW